MSITLPLLTELFFFGFTLWLGAYLLSRNSHKAAVQLTGWGLLAYAFALAVEIIFQQFILVVMLIPALLWIGAAITLLPEESKLREILLRVWMLSSIPIAILTLLNAWFAAIIIGALLTCVVMVARLASRAQFKNTIALLAVIALFITLSTGLLIIPLDWLPRVWVITLLGLDLICLGLAITAWDAFDEGESIRAHILRSFVSAFYYSAILAVLAIALDGNLLLLISLTVFAILTQTFSNSIQTLLDKLTLPRAVHHQRQTLRETADVLPRLSALEPAEADEMQFARLTRRALSHRADYNALDETSRAALDWFQTSVPERTLHNWQNTAAKLVAEDVKSKSDCQSDSRHP